MLNKIIEATRAKIIPVLISDIMQIINGKINKTNDLILWNEFLMFFHVTLFHALTIIITAQE